jgi:hypothetical protein
MVGYKFQLTREEGITVTVELNDQDASIHTLAPVIVEFLIAAGFVESTIKQYVSGVAYDPR